MMTEDTRCHSCKVRCQSVFRDLDIAALHQMDNIKTCRSYAKGAQLFREGSYPKGLYCVRSGKIKITQTGADGKEQIVHLIHDGDVMGHRAILGNDTYSCSATALGETQVCFLPKAPFYEMLQQNSRLTLQVAHLLADELKEAERKVTSTAHQPVKDRLAQSLLSLKENYGMEQDQSTINIIIKREELANLAGTTRETATRLLYELQAERIIELKGKKIRLLNERLLLRIAQRTY